MKSFSCLCYWINIYFNYCSFLYKAIRFFPEKFLSSQSFWKVLWAFALRISKHNPSTHSSRSPSSIPFVQHELQLINCWLSFIAVFPETRCVPLDKQTEINRRYGKCLSNKTSCLKAAQASNVSMAETQRSTFISPS